MVKAELAYNPYLQETKIRFNGRSPRVNSRVEMYLKEKLHDWIEELPEIFRDEMNGYDFDLDFSGTKNDFEDLKKAFEKALEKEKKGAGVSKPEVNIFLRNEIGGREEKLEKIEELMNWLTKSPKRLYDLEEVQKENPDLFGGTYEYIVMHGSEKDENAFENLNVSVENITDLKTLKDTNLCYTPILYVIDDNSLEFLVKDIFDLREKLGDQLPRQLFFRISKELDKEMIIHELNDLGMSNPQIVESAENESIQRYLLIYPCTESIQRVITLFRQGISEVRGVLEEQNERMERSNRMVHTQIKYIDDQLQLLRDAQDKFKNPEREDYKSKFLMEKVGLISGISTWRNRKLSTAVLVEAKAYAQDLSSFVQRQYSHYAQSMKEIFKREIGNTKDTCYEWYASGQVDLDFKADDVPIPDFGYYAMDLIFDTLMTMHEQVFVQQEEDLVGKLFRKGNVNQDKIVPQNVFYFHKWREYAASRVSARAEALEATCTQKLSEYFERLIAAYDQHLEMIIAQSEAYKDERASQLSGEERSLQRDSDWLSRFSEFVKKLERD